MPAHDLQHECPLVAEKQEERQVALSCFYMMLNSLLASRLATSHHKLLSRHFLSPSRSSPLSGGHDGVDHLDDAVQSRVGADGHVRAAEVVIDGADHPHDVQYRVSERRLVIDQT